MYYVTTNSYNEFEVNISKYGREKSGKLKSDGLTHDGLTNDEQTKSPPGKLVGD